MTTLRGRCLYCGAVKSQGKYLCWDCWNRLLRPEQIKLSKKDGLAGVRLLEMSQQLGNGVPPEEVRVSA